MSARSLLICHLDAPSHYDGIPRWLASSTELAGIVALKEAASTRCRRVKREYRRSGVMGIADVAPMRLHYRMEGIS